MLAAITILLEEMHQEMDRQVIQVMREVVALVELLSYFGKRSVL